MKQLSLPLKEIYPIMAETIQNGGEVYLTVRGNSMSPFLADGRDQAVFVSPDKMTIKRGDIVFYQR
ncbi:MAG: S24/S26 family peptidase, partial [Clostridia bacterium]|nr:S24/S26 family peptidase [Clostridia bacterium]